MDKKDYHFYIKVRTTLSMSRTIIRNELIIIFGDEALSYAIVAKWTQCFRQDREEIEDEAFPGRRVTETTDKDTQQICDAAMTACM